MVWCKFQPNPSKKEIAVGRASENTTVGNGHMGRANMFWTVKTFNQENLECLGFIFTKYELYMYIHIQKNNVEPVFSTWRGDN